MAESTCGLLVIVLTLAALLSRTNNPQPPRPPDPPHNDTGIANIAMVIGCSLVAGVLSGFAGGILAGMVTRG
jgi:cytochrome b561